jgi:hypothetical protein
MPCLVRTKEDRLGWRSEERADLHSWESQVTFERAADTKAKSISAGATGFAEKLADPLQLVCILKHWASLA